MSMCTKEGGREVAYFVIPCLTSTAKMLCCGRVGFCSASFKKKKTLLRAMCTQLKSYDEKVSDSPQQLYPNKIISRKGQRSKALGGDMSAVQKKKSY